MEITYTQLQTYSLDLSVQGERSLAKHLGITVKKMKILVDGGELMDDYSDQVTAWVGDHSDEAEVTAHEDIEIDEITL
jgi:hypothetical protein